MRRLTICSIRVKLLGTVVLVLLCAGGVGLWNLANLRAASAAFRAISYEQLPAVDHLLEADRDMQQALVAERSLMFVRQASDEAAGMRKSHAENRMQVRERWEKYTALGGSEPERELWTSFEAKLAAWEKLTDEVVALLAQDDVDARKDAIDVSMSEGAAAFDAAREVLNTLSEQRLEAAKTYADGVEARAGRIGRWSIGLLVALTISSLGAALLLARLIARPLGEVVAVTGAAAGGDLTRRAAVAGEDELGRMGRALNGMLDSFRESMLSVKQSGGRTATAAGQLAGGAAQLSSAAQEQASSLEETAASLEQMTATVKQNADGAREANSLVADVQRAAEAGGAVVQEAVTAMAAITTASTEIAAISTTIDEIAFQTNLLALNAAVEAARAGDQGRGFAVVATEVRALAQRAAAASREIRVLITDASAKVKHGSSLVTRSGATLGDIVRGVTTVARLIADIAAASAEQAQGIEQVNRAVVVMEEATQHTASETEQLSATAQALHAQAADLEALVERFSLTAEPGQAQNASTS
jgi:methyl-accepting chemotaxis protein